MKVKRNTLDIHNKHNGNIHHTIENSKTSTNTITTNISSFSSSSSASASCALTTTTSTGTLSSSSTTIPPGTTTLPLITSASSALTATTPSTNTSLTTTATTKSNTNTNTAITANMTITNTNENKDESKLDLMKEKDKKIVDLTGGEGGKGSKGGGGGGGGLKMESDLEETKPLTRSAASVTSLEIALIKKDDDAGVQEQDNGKSNVKIEDESTTVPKTATTTSSSLATTTATTSAGNSKASGGNKKKRSAIVDDLQIADEEHYNRLKRRKIKVAGAPKLPLTGYVRYMNERRELLRKEYPTKTAMEHTRMISEEWHKLSEDVKSPYINAAAIDKERYEDELNCFLKANPNVLANELAKNKPVKAKANDSKATVLKEKSLSAENLKVPPAAKDTKVKQKQEDVKPNAATVAQNDVIKNVSTATNGVMKSSENCAIYTTNTPGEIPIFTNEFLEHNKIFDTAFRGLRKSKQELEIENSVLEQHVENMKVGVKKMSEENDELQEKNKFLLIYFEKLKKKLAIAFAGLALPNEPNGATEDNIEQYMQQLYDMATTNTHGPAFLNKAKDILRKLDMQIQL